jgi:hypothetical protein
MSEGQRLLEFPARIYTEEEVKKAKHLIDNGYRHRLRTQGSPNFKLKVRKALKLIKVARYYCFLRTYIRTIKVFDGLTQLRQAEATIWANKYAVENPVDAASVLVQKASQMKEYLEGRLYYGGTAEKRSDEKRIKFLQALKNRSGERAVMKECERLLKMWEESSLVY